MTASGSSYAQVAQSVEQRTENPRVDGSIPSLGTTPFFLAHSVFHGHQLGGF